MSPLPEEKKDTPQMSAEGDVRSDVRLLMYQVGIIDKKIEKFFDEVRTTYATKVELKAIQDELNKIRETQGWVVKSIVGAVIAAVLGVIFVKGGIPH